MDPLIEEIESLEVTNSGPIDKNHWRKVFNRIYPLKVSKLCRQLKASNLTPDPSAILNAVTYAEKLHYTIT